MKAKRVKQQRKTMHVYQMQFSFREPYLVLITSDCLRALHAFAMPIQKFLENTLHGKVMPYITQCTLAKVMEGYSGKGRDGRPAYLPPPTDIPLRYCKHKDEQGQERGAIAEHECLLDLISGHAKGNEVKKNTQHYILATADWDEGIKDPEERQKVEAQRRKRRKMGQPDGDIRGYARMIPGVPIVYVKRSVMVLEEPSVASDRAIRGVEKDKFRDGIGGAARGTKRGREEDSDGEEANGTNSKKRGAKRVRGPNPLSVKKKKPKSDKKPGESGNSNEQPQGTSTSKKRRRGKRGKTNAQAGEIEPQTAVAAEE